MKRRDFITLIGGAAAAWPLTARAQQPAKLRTIGFLYQSTPSVESARAAAFLQQLHKLGWIEGSTIAIEYRSAAGRPERMAEIAAEFVQLNVEVIVGNENATPTIRQATSTIPIVFAVVNDPVAQGFIPNMGHPGGNLTGFSFLEYSVVGKSLEMLRQIAPKTVRVAVMFNPETYPYYDIHLKSFGTVAKQLSLDLLPAPVRSASEIDDAISRLGEQAGSALLVTPDPFMLVHRDLVLRAAAQYRVPATYSYRQYVREGGLTSYGADANDIFFRSASYIDRILKGAVPGDLPAQTPAKFEIAVNLKTAKALGLEVPPNLVAVANEVIE